MPPAHHDTPEHETAVTAQEAGDHRIWRRATGGQAVRHSGLDRADVFVTSKLNNGAHGRDDALQAVDRTMEELGFAYLDVFHIHWPLPGKRTSWRPGSLCMPDWLAGSRCM
ncbi:aldo/keto reductase [Streptomyces brevispora]|uniref:aldo/keto reductase n=1 Tax=Streptomyces brevispora TaxID=887462 RepID=UPI00380E057E